ncbi:MAG: S8 family serine peptidase [Nanoarchaeota archaeon]
MVDQIGLTAAWKTTKGRPSVVVAVVDSGIDGRHPGLKNKLTTGTSGSRDSDDLTDRVGHGTQLASIVARVAPDCRLLSVKIAVTVAQFTASRMAAAIARAVDRGANVILIGCATPVDDLLLRQAVEHALARGIPVIAPVGNGGNSAVMAPARYPGVIGVGAADDLGAREEFSNRGFGLTRCAPGRNIPTAELGGTTVFAEGTSAARGRSCYIGIAPWHVC